MSTKWISSHLACRIDEQPQKSPKDRTFKLREWTCWYAWVSCLSTGHPGAGAHAASPSWKTLQPLWNDCELWHWRYQHLLFEYKTRFHENGWAATWFRLFVLGSTATTMACDLQKYVIKYASYAWMTIRLTLWSAPGHLSVTSWLGPSKESTFVPEPGEKSSSFYSTRNSLLFSEAKLSLIYYYLQLSPLSHLVIRSYSAFSISRPVAKAAPNKAKLQAHLICVWFMYYWKVFKSCILKEILDKNLRGIFDATKGHPHTQKLCN